MKIEGNAESETHGGHPLAPAVSPGNQTALDFHATSRDRTGATVGVLVDSRAKQHLSMTSAGEWQMSSAVPAGLKPVLFYESAANVLRGGSKNSDGTITYQGDSYVVDSKFDGTDWTAKLRS